MWNNGKEFLMKMWKRERKTLNGPLKIIIKNFYKRVLIKTKNIKRIIFLQKKG